MAWLAASVERSISFQRVLAGVVIRLTSTMSSSHSMPPVAAWSWPACPCVARGAVAVLVVLVAAGLRHQLRRQQLHAAARAAARLLGDDVEVHRAGVGRPAPAAAASCRSSGSGPAPRRRPRGASGRRRRAARPSDGVEVHLGHEGQRLVRLGVQPRGEPLALGRELGVAAQDLELLGQAGSARSSRP